MSSKLNETLGISKAKPETAVASRRVPIGADRDVLWVAGKDPNKKYAWINEENVRHMQASGFEFVPPGSVTVASNATRYGNSLQESVISKPVGAGVTAFLMYIDKDLYEQDMALIDAKTAEQEADIYRDAKSGGLVGELKFGRGKKNLD
jgi:hypothetical protein